MEKQLFSLWKESRISLHAAGISYSLGWIHHYHLTKSLHFKELLCCSESLTKLLVCGGRGAIFHFSFFHVTES